MTRIRRLLFFGLVGWGFLMMNQPTIEAAARSSHVCSELCDGSSTCDAECWLTQFDYDQNYPSTTCGAESFACCGDGMCTTNAEACSACTEDCGETSCGGGIECFEDDDCDTGEICNASLQCITPPDPQSGGGGSTCGGSCSNSSSCCGTDLCQNGTCGPISRGECSGAPDCSGYLDSHAYSNCDFTSVCTAQTPTKTSELMYCDPSLGTIGKCQYRDQPLCSANTVGAVCK